MAGKVLMVFSIAVFTLILPQISLCSGTEESGFQAGPVILLSGDAILACAAVAALMQQNSLADDYEALRLQIDGTSEAAYYRLLYEREKVISAGDTALIACSLAGAALTYTVLDYLWLHGVFKAAILPTTDGVMGSLTVRF